MTLDHSVIDRGSLVFDTESVEGAKALKGKIKAERNGFILLCLKGIF